jgi:hypothetical protein
VVRLGGPRAIFRGSIPDQAIPEPQEFCDFGAFGLSCKLISALQLRQVNRSYSALSSLDLLATMVTPQIGQALIGGRPRTALMAVSTRVQVDPKHRRRES